MSDRSYTRNFKDADGNAAGAVTYPLYGMDDHSIFENDAARQAATDTLVRANWASLTRDYLEENPGDFKGLQKVVNKGLMITEPQRRAGGGRKTVRKVSAEDLAELQSQFGLDEEGFAALAARLNLKIQVEE